MMCGVADLLVNIDVPDLAAAERFYTRAFGLKVTRRFGVDGLELTGWPVKVYLLAKAEGTIGAGNDARRYSRHWSPVHLDVVVEDIDHALMRALSAGAKAESEIRTDIWGHIVVLSDPFGHGICLIQFLNRGYDEVSTRP
jgi:predicted enzyme related to lactoylglutathione lyase